MTPPDRLTFEKNRVDEILRVLERMAGGDTSIRLTISNDHDELDAIAHAINVLVGELAWTGERMVEAQEARVAAAERADASKTAFIRDLGHEIRTPIAAMIGFADLLLSGDSAQAPAELLQRLQTNGKVVLTLLDDLLDLAKLDADRIDLHPQPVQLAALIREVVAGVDVSGRARHLELRVDTARNELQTFITDRFRVRQILVNLVSNAVKFTARGSVTIAVRTWRAHDAERCAIDVVDTGLGISPAWQARIFEPFEQAALPGTSRYGGSGLGLTLSRRLALRLGGQLELVESAPGQGLTFRLSLTPLPAPQGPAADAVANVIGGSAEIAGLRILLAEDHSDLHMALRAMLEGAGAIVSSAYDGGDAVAQALASPFDVVLMDLRMPHTDGLLATRELRSRGCMAHIVALTADPATLWRESALEAGCDDCLSKPFTIEQIVVSIRNPPRRMSSG